MSVNCFSSVYIYNFTTNKRNVIFIYFWGVLLEEEIHQT